MNTNLQKDCEYSIELGDSFNNNSSSQSSQQSSQQEFHSLVYKFKPKSLKENSWEGKIDIDTSSTIVHLNTSSNRLFKGTFESYKKPNIHECILIYDKNSNTFTLEKLHATIGALQQIDNSTIQSNNQSNNNNNNNNNSNLNNLNIAETIIPNNNNSLNNLSNLNRSNSTTIQLLNNSNSNLNNLKTTPPKRSLTPSSSTHSLDIELQPKKKLKDSPPTFNPIMMNNNINNNMNNNNSLMNNINNMNNMNMNNNNLIEMPKPIGLRSEIDSKNALDSDSSGSDVDSDSSDSDSSDSDSDSSDSSDSDSS